MMELKTEFEVKLLGIPNYSLYIYSLYIFGIFNTPKAFYIQDIF